MGGIAIANVHSIDLKCVRNPAILGFSIMIGMCVPKFYENNSNIINTGF